MILLGIYQVTSPSYAEISSPNLNENQELSTKENPSSTEMDSWQRLFQSRLNNLDSFNEDMKEFNRGLPAKFKEIETDFSLISKKFHTAKIIAELSKTHPMELSMLRETIIRMSQTVKNMILPLEHSMESLQDQLKEILQLVQGDHHLDSLYIQDKEIEIFLRKLEIAQEKVKELKEQFNNHMEPMIQLQSEIEEFRISTTDSIPDLWNDDYMKSAGILFNPREWHDFYNRSADIKNTFLMRLDIQIPQSTKAWRGLFIRVLMASLLFTFVFYLKRFLLAHPKTPYAQWGLRVCNNSLIWLCISLIFFAAAFSQEGNYYYFIGIGGLLMSFSQMNMAWDIYAFNHPEIPRRSMLCPLFALPIMGSLILLLDMPPVAVTTTWLTLLTVAAFIVYHQKKDNYPFRSTAYLDDCLPALHSLYGDSDFLWLRSTFYCSVHVLRKYRYFLATECGDHNSCRGYIKKN